MSSHRYAVLGGALVGSVVGSVATAGWVYVAIKYLRALERVRERLG